jgi:hypothetical protein
LRIYHAAETEEEDVLALKFQAYLTERVRLDLASNEGSQTIDDLFRIISSLSKKGTLVALPFLLQIDFDDSLKRKGILNTVMHFNLQADKVAYDLLEDILVFLIPKQRSVCSFRSVRFWSRGSFLKRRRSARRDFAFCRISSRSLPPKTSTFAP